MPAGPFFGVLGLMFLALLTGFEGNPEALIDTDRTASAATPEPQEFRPTALVESAFTSVRTGQPVHPAFSTNNSSAPVNTSPATLSQSERDARAQALNYQVNQLETQLAYSQIHEPKSPYATVVSLHAGSARERDVDDEKLTLTITGSVGGSINISNWSLESIVTGKQVTIPEGNALPTRIRRSSLAPIRLSAGDMAHLYTTDSPVDYSFKENICIGYFTELRGFDDVLYQQCPAPLTDLHTYSESAYTDSECYNFVRSVPRCEVPDDDDIDDANLSNRCEQFLEELDYSGCVDEHRFDDNFTGPRATWHVYLDSNRELWRQNNETIRLLDGQGRVVSVVTY